MARSLGRVPLLLFRSRDACFEVLCLECACSACQQPTTICLAPALSKIGLCAWGQVLGAHRKGGPPKIGDSSGGGGVEGGGHFFFGLLVVAGWVCHGWWNSKNGLGSFVVFFLWRIGVGGGGGWHVESGKVISQDGGLPRSSPAGCTCATPWASARRSSSMRTRRLGFWVGSSGRAAGRGRFFVSFSFFWGGGLHGAWWFGCFVFLLGGGVGWGFVWVSLDPGKREADICAGICVRLMWIVTLGFGLEPMAFGEGKWETP